MKNKQLEILLWIFTVIMVSNLNSLAQRGYRMGGGYSCCLDFPGLTEKQKTEINRLEQQHRKGMDELRANWLNSGDYTRRSEHLAEVDKKVREHRDAVYNLLSDEQKVVFNNIPGRSGRNRFGMNRMGTGCGPCCRGYYWQGGRFGRDDRVGYSRGCGRGWGSRR